MDRQRPQHAAVAFHRGAGKETLAKLAALRSNIDWVANVPLAIALVFDGQDTVLESFDEGRIYERLAIAARLLGLGAGTAWFLGDEEEKQAKELLGVPAGADDALHGRDRHCRQGRQPAPGPQLCRPQTAGRNRQLRDDVGKVQSPESGAETSSSSVLRGPMPLPWALAFGL